MGDSSAPEAGKADNHHAEPRRRRSWVRAALLLVEHLPHVERRSAGIPDQSFTLLKHGGGHLGNGNAAVHAHRSSGSVGDIQQGNGQGGVAGCAHGYDVTSRNGRTRAVGPLASDHVIAVVNVGSHLV